MKNKILLEIANFCEGCGSNCCCPEDECILFRIEKIILKKKGEMKNDKNTKSRINGKN